nr:MAG TPA: hypothetical protein [Caudoviricetes sp.]
MSIKLLVEFCRYQKTSYSKCNLIESLHQKSTESISKSIEF